MKILHHDNFHQSAEGKDLFIVLQTNLAAINSSTSYSCIPTYESRPLARPVDSASLAVSNNIEL